MKEKILVCFSFTAKAGMDYVLIISNYRVILIRLTNPLFGSILGGIIDAVFYSSRLKKLNENLRKNRNELDKALEINLEKKIFLLKDIESLDFKEDVFIIHLKDQNILRFKFDKSKSFQPYLDDNITMKNIFGRMSNLRRDFLKVIGEINNPVVSDMTEFPNRT